MTPTQRVDARRLAVTREERGLTQSALARVVHMTRSYLSLIERGRRQPSDDMLNAIASALDLRVDDLLVDVPVTFPVSLDPCETAWALGVHVNTVYKMLHRGELVGAKVGRQWRISPQEIQRVLRGSEVAA